MTRFRLVPLLAVLAAALLNGPPLRADDKALPSDLALAAHDATGFVSIRVGDLAASAAGKELLQQLHKDKEWAGDLLADLHRELVVPPADIERLTLVLDTQLMIVRTTQPYDRDKMLDALGGEAKVKRIKGKTVYLSGDERALMPIDANVFVRGPVGQLEKLLTPRPVNPESQAALAEALELAAGKHQVTIGVNPLAYLLAQRSAEEESVRSSEATAPAATPPSPPPPAIEKKEPPPCDDPPAEPAKPERAPDAQELFKEMPREALPFKPLFEARCITLTLDLDEGLRLEGRATYADKALAADGETSVKTTLYVMRELLPMAGEELLADPEAAKQLQPLFRQLQEALRTATVRIEGTTVTVSAQAKIDPAAVAGLVLQLRGSADNIRSANNLKQIALAITDFSDAYAMMPPPAICDKNGKPLLSWRVAILPYIEQGNLYQQFKLDEPWDSPNNKPLLARMPKIYAPIRAKTKQPYSTFYQVFVGPGAPFQIAPTPGQGPFGARGSAYPATFTDGTSNTLLVVEAGEAVPWTKPDDIPFDEKKPVPPLGGDFGFGFHAALADGEVLFIKNNINQQLLKWLIMPADGNVIDWDKVPVIGRRPSQARSTEGGGGDSSAVKVKPPPDNPVPPPAKPPEKEPRPPEKR